MARRHKIKVETYLTYSLDWAGTIGITDGPNGPVIDLDGKVLGSADTLGNMKKITVLDALQIASGNPKASQAKNELVARWLEAVRS